MLRFQDGKLLAQGQVLKKQITTGRHTASQQAEEELQHTKHERFVSETLSKYRLGATRGYLAVGFGAMSYGVDVEGVDRIVGEADAVVSDAKP
jgi:hypothetical protein